MEKSEIKGTSVCIVGYGREGQSVHKYLRLHYPEVTIGIADKSFVKPTSPVASLHVGTKYLDNLGGYSTLIRSPGISVRQPELVAFKKSGGHITSATNIFFSEYKGITIGVTGTKGKSTTSSLIAQILKTCYPDVRLVGNIGNPALDNLDGGTKNTIFVIELSSHQLADAHYSPHIAVILGVFAEHMDYYQNFDQYARAKTNIVAFQTKKDTVVYDDANKVAGKIAQSGKGEKIPVSRYKTFPIPKTMLLGNNENILAAIAVSSIFNVPPRLMRLAIRGFLPLPHRLEFVGEFRGVTFYNDSLATIPEATIHALEALGENVETLIAGGFDRGLDYRDLGTFLAERKGLKTLFLFPDTGETIWTGVLKANPKTQIKKYDVSSMKDAVKLAYAHSSPGKICLLSPASASFNLFKDYADRGNAFKNYVVQIGTR